MNKLKTNNKNIINGTIEFNEGDTFVYSTLGHESRTFFEYTSRHSINNLNRITRLSQNNKKLHEDLKLKGVLIHTLKTIQDILDRNIDDVIDILNTINLMNSLINYLDTLCYLDENGKDYKSIYESITEMFSFSSENLKKIQKKDLGVLNFNGN